jgi:hypothetical protein
MTDQPQPINNDSPAEDAQHFPFGLANNPPVFARDIGPSPYEAAASDPRDALIWDKVRAADLATQPEPNGTP